MKNLIYWFIHNEIFTPIFITFLLIFAIIIAPFYRIWLYFYVYYRRVNLMENRIYEDK